MAIVVDTNVAMVASRLTSQADERCVNACIKRLVAIQQGGGLLVDDSFQILSEYRKKLTTEGQTGAGYEFYKWAITNQAIADKVTRIVITPTTDAGWRKFNEFPDSPALKGFDRSDQKFVAVALASGENPPILNAVDSDWWHHLPALTAAGVTVEFLCPQHAKGSKAGRRKAGRP